MSNFGLAVGTLDLETDELEIHGLTLVETKAGSNKKTVRVNSDDLRRASEIWRVAKPIIDKANMVFVSYRLGAKTLVRRRLTVFVSVYLRVWISH